MKGIVDWLDEIVDDSLENQDMDACSGDSRAKMQATMGRRVPGASQRRKQGQIGLQQGRVSPAA